MKTFRCVGSAVGDLQVSQSGPWATVRSGCDALFFSCLAPTPVGGVSGVSAEQAVHLVAPGPVDQLLVTVGPQFARVTTGAKVLWASASAGACSPFGSSVFFGAAILGKRIAVAHVAPSGTPALTILSIARPNSGITVDLPVPCATQYCFAPRESGLVRVGAVGVSRDTVVVDVSVGGAVSRVVRMPDGFLPDVFVDELHLLGRNENDDLQVADVETGRVLGAVEIAADMFVSGAPLVTTSDGNSFGIADGVVFGVRWRGGRLSLFDVELANPGGMPFPIDVITAIQGRLVAGGGGRVWWFE